MTHAKGPLGQRVAMGTAVRSGRGLEGLGKALGQALVLRAACEPTLCVPF